jgi:hypothetical protein
MNDTTNAAKRPSGLRACADGLDVNPDKDFAQKCMRYAADRMEQLERELTAVTEQRDGLRSGIDYASDQLTKVTEQRDRLADLVKQFIYILDITEESDGGRLFHPTNITSCRAGDLQKIGELVEALRRSSNDR